MIVINNTPNIYVLKSNSKMLLVNPWVKTEVPPEFYGDTTFRMALDAKALIPYEPHDDFILERTEAKRQEVMRQAAEAENAMEEVAEAVIEAVAEEESSEAEEEPKQTKTPKKK